MWTRFNNLWMKGPLQDIRTQIPKTEVSRTKDHGQRTKDKLQRKSFLMEHLLQGHRNNSVPKKGTRIKAKGQMPKEKCQRPNAKGQIPKVKFQRTKLEKGSRRSAE